MNDSEVAVLVAARARATFLAIKALRKANPQRTSAQRQDLERDIQQAKDAWWDDVRALMVRP